MIVQRVLKVIVQLMVVLIVRLDKKTIKHLKHNLGLLNIIKKRIRKKLRKIQNNTMKITENILNNIMKITRKI